MRVLWFSEYDFTKQVVTHSATVLQSRLASTCLDITIGSIFYLYILLCLRLSKNRRKDAKAMEHDHNLSPSRSRL